MILQKPWSERAGTDLYTFTMYHRVLEQLFWVGAHDDAVLSPTQKSRGALGFVEGHKRSRVAMRDFKLFGVSRPESGKHKGQGSDARALSRRAHVMPSGSLPRSHHATGALDLPYSNRDTAREGDTGAISKRMYLITVTAFAVDWLWRADRQLAGHRLQHGEPAASGSVLVLKLRRRRRQAPR
jgi:hypothetical protein